MVGLVISSVIQVCLFSLIPFICWLITGRKENFFKWLGIKKPRFTKKITTTLLITIVAAAVYTLVMTFVTKHFLGGVDTSTSQFAGMGLATVPSALIYALIQTSLSEEIFFRGFLAKRLIGKLGFAAGNSIQALCFGLVHGVPLYLATTNILVLILATLFPALIGFYMGYLNEKMAEGSIVPSWLTHGVLNIISAIVAGL